ncbi:MAG: hypothetical protein CMF98_05575 [Candidatus Marinimicrobia bacterium]|nr:hypothetical protein [Candidatus Neomarinimicrobiota bacterium]OUW50124.1 MAG: hypothetical protein CBD50_04110 [bacterium TMED190]
MEKIKKSLKFFLKLSPFFTKYNIFIVVLFLISSSFIISIVDRHLKFGIKMDYSFSNTPPHLIIDPIKEYENSIYKDIKVEVLNGCGEKGIAKDFSDYLINQHVDVVRSENTPGNNFDYKNTQLILRTEDFQDIARIASLLDINPKDSTKVIVETNLNLLTDVTLIIGKDFKNIIPVQNFILSQP